MDQATFLSIGSLDRNDVRLLGPSFEQTWPVDKTPCFEGLLRAIDRADWQSRNPPPALH